MSDGGLERTSLPSYGPPIGLEKCLAHCNEEVDTKLDSSDIQWCQAKSEN